MTDLATVLNALRRPKILIRAARAASSTTAASAT